MADPEQINADQRTFWNGQGGRTWVARQEHTDITLASVSEALLAALGRASAGRRLRLRRIYTGHCASRRPIGARGSARHLRTDVG